MNSSAPEHNPLRIVAIEGSPSAKPRQAGRPSARLAENAALRDKYNALWMEDAAQFDPTTRVTERLRIQRTLDLVDELGPVEGWAVVDLGCGAGTIARALRDRGAHVTAVDVADEALRRIHKTDGKGITLKQECLPFTSLPENAFDLVIATDLLAELAPRDFRLFFSELARLVKRDGAVLCSTGLDTRTIDPLGRFLSLLATEFEIDAWRYSYHADYLCVRRCLEWIRCHKLVESETICQRLEPFTKALRGDNGMSHAIFWMKKRPLETKEETKERRWKKKPEIVPKHEA